jgi:hypothetical protein
VARLTGTPNRHLLKGFAKLPNMSAIYLRNAGRMAGCEVVRQGRPRHREFGTPPDQIIGTKYINDNPGNGVAFTRPLCVFPSVAKYKGSSNSADAANWVCVKGLVNDTTRDADAVLLDRGDQPGDHD